MQFRHQPSFSPKRALEALHVFPGSDLNLRAWLTSSWIVKLCSTRRQLSVHAAASVGFHFGSTCHPGVPHWRSDIGLRALGPVASRSLGSIHRPIELIVYVLACYLIHVLLLILTRRLNDGVCEPHIFYVAIYNSLRICFGFTPTADYLFHEARISTSTWKRIRLPPSSTCYKLSTVLRIWIRTYQYQVMFLSNNRIQVEVGQLVDTLLCNCPASLERCDGQHGRLGRGS